MKKKRKQTKNTRKTTQIAFAMGDVYGSKMNKAFGGAAKKGHPKTRRPFSSKHNMHLVLKSAKATGSRSMLRAKNKPLVDGLVYSLAKKLGIQIKNYANVGNHLHILVNANNRKQLSAYLRSLSGLIPRKILDCEKGLPLGFKFWDGRPFSRIVAVGKRPFVAIKRYFAKNQRQAQKIVLGFEYCPHIDTG